MYLGTVVDNFCHLLCVFIIALLFEINLELKSLSKQRLRGIDEDWLSGLPLETANRYSRSYRIS